MNNWMKDNLSSVFNLFMIAAPSVYLPLSTTYVDLYRKRASALK